MVTNSADRRKRIKKILHEGKKDLKKHKNLGVQMTKNN